MKTMNELTWEESKSQNPKDFLSESEYKVYVDALGEFNEMLKNTKPKRIKKFAESGLGISAMRFSKQFADPHEKPNLYKSIYGIIFNYQYEIQRPRTIGTAR